MDDLIDIGITILLRRLKDKKKFEAYREAVRKVIRKYQFAFPTDEIWAEVIDRHEGKK